MRTGWVRYEFASLVFLGAIPGVLAACSSDDDGATTPADAGTRDTGAPDTGTVDAGTRDADADAGPQFQNAKITVVNAATDFGPDSTVAGGSGFQAARICFAVGPSAGAATVAPVPPQPETAPEGLDTPGLYFGTGGKLPSFGLDLQDLVVVPYVMNAKLLKDRGVVKPGPGVPGLACDQLLRDGFTYDSGAGLTEGVDYWRLDPIPARTFLHDKSFALVLTGCAGNAQVNPNDKCGGNFATGDRGNGNLKVTVYEMDRATAVPASSVGVQFVQASSAADRAFRNSVLGTPIAVQPGFITDPTTGAGSKPVTTYSGADGVPYPSPITPLTNAEGVNFAQGGDSFTASPLPAAAALAMPLTTIEALSGFAAGTYRNGASYTYFLVGDPDPAIPTMVGSAFNLRKYHFLALPNDPVIEDYAP